MARSVSIGACFAILGLAVAAGLTGCGPSEPATTGGPLTMRRITEGEYRQIVADIFGGDIKYAGSFQPDIRKDGLLAVGSSDVVISRTGLEQYDTIARTVAAQALDEHHRDTVVPCHPAQANQPDDVCAAQFVGKIGRLLIRRPLSAERLKAWTDDAHAAAASSGNFYTGLQFTLGAMLIAPEFLFRVDVAEPDPHHAGSLRLDAFSKATRLSFLLWDAGPDDELLTAAEHGDLDSRSGLAHQVDRMLASPRLESGVRTFFSDFLGFDSFASLEKDPIAYPKFSQRLAADAKEQALRTVTDLLVTRDGDYRDIFTTRRTFMTRALGAVYAVPVAAPTGWEPYEFAENDPRAGLLAQVSFTALHAHPGRSSATLRGKAIREFVLCQPVPAPPNNVNFAIVQDTSNQQLKTARDRLTAHRSDPTCAGCHKIIDPLGLALENFDGLGQYRMQENGAALDTSGEIDGSTFVGSQGLGKALHDDPAAVSCLVSSVYRYAAGRVPAPGEKDWMVHLQKQFAGEGYKLRDLLRHIALSDAFYRIAPADGATPMKEASK